MSSKYIFIKTKNNMAIYSIITGSGSYIPKNNIKNSDFLGKDFYDLDGNKIDTESELIIDKFKEITTIEKRRYADNNQNCSDLGYEAAKEAIKNSRIDAETLDYIIVAHNFGDMGSETQQTDILPSLASRIKQKLGLKNPKTVAYDVIFGCPGWVQAMIQADYYIKSGDAKKILVIGADLISRAGDPHDRDSMIFSDGAGAVILEGKESDKPIGILGHNSRSDTLEYADLLYMGYSNKKEAQKDKKLYIKMYGRRLYVYALENVPKTLKAVLDKVNIPIDDVKKILLHQANGKMDDAIVKRFLRLYGIRKVPKGILPMTISWLGNSAVATVPTLYDLIAKGQMENEQFKKDDIIIFASVGAGMNINSIVYKIP